MNLNKLSEMSEEELSLLSTAIAQEKQKRLEKLKVGDVVVSIGGFPCIIKEITPSALSGYVYQLYYADSLPENWFYADKNDFTIPKDKPNEP